MIYIFSNKYFDELLKVFPNALKGEVYGMKYIELENSEFLASYLANLAGGQTKMYEDFLKENNYIHLEAFANICTHM